MTTTNNNAYKRFWYGADFTASYATVNTVADEAYSIEVTDGLGRVKIRVPRVEQDCSIKVKLAPMLSRYYRN